MSLSGETAQVRHVGWAMSATNTGCTGTDDRSMKVERPQGSGSWLHQERMRIKLECRQETVLRLGSYTQRTFAGVWEQQEAETSNKGTR